MNKGISKLITSFIGKDTIKEATQGIKNFLIDYKKKYPLQENETELIGILIERDNEVLFFTATIDQENKVGRLENRHNMEEVAETLLKNL